eukprot:3410609-Ditylum_brightwellii.AAC.1
MDNKERGRLITRSTFLHNTKVTTSTFHEDQAREKQRDSGHPRGCAVALAEMLHVMLKYPE